MSASSRALSAAAKSARLVRRLSVVALGVDASPIATARGPLHAGNIAIESTGPSIRPEVAEQGGGAQTAAHQVRHARTDPARGRRREVRLGIHRGEGATYLPRLGADRHPQAQVRRLAVGLGKAPAAPGRADHEQRATEVPPLPKASAAATAVARVPRRQLSGP